jgi:hypothetical protein
MEPDGGGCGDVVRRVVVHEVVKVRVVVGGGGGRGLAVASFAMATSVRDGSRLLQEWIRGKGKRKSKIWNLLEVVVTTWCDGS